MGKEESHFLALDPGLHTGWALWKKDGVFIDMGTIHGEKELHDFLAGLPTAIEVVIIEDFVLFKNKAVKQAGSKMPAPKAIAQIETFARLWEAKVVKQQPSIKPIAEKMTGVKTKGLPHAQTHVLDAFNHGEYYLYAHGIKQIDINI
jgi:hypothetical protein